MSVKSNRVKTVPQNYIHKAVLSVFPSKYIPFSYTKYVGWYPEEKVLLTEEKTRNGRGLTSLSELKRGFCVKVMGN